MFTKAQTKDLIAADDLLYETGLNYILIALSEEYDYDKSSKFYFGLNSPCTEDDAVMFTDLMIRIMYNTMMDYLPEESRPDIEISEWSYSVLKEVHKRIQQRSAEFEIDEDFNN